MHISSLGKNRAPTLFVYNANSMLSNIVDSSSFAMSSPLYSKQKPTEGEKQSQVQKLWALKVLLHRPRSTHLGSGIGTRGSQEPAGTGERTGPWGGAGKRFSRRLALDICSLVDVTHREPDPAVQTLRWQRQKLDCIVRPQGAADRGSESWPLCQLSYKFRDAGIASKSDNTPFPPFPGTPFPTFSTNRSLFSAAKIIYGFLLFSLAESSSTPTPPSSGQTLHNSAGI
ncbi:uncharacterized protein LOC112621599 [Theropithecus gelada]|uniref:uncharacterized protein LOC112621599 n=1 Tax=Theropithecus gelada TaxID=9565 RepID=UPI000DC1A7C2|nr:uncharacterized protein LOC112621599 [Theropithecus gelada]